MHANPILIILVCLAAQAIFVGANESTDKNRTMEVLKVSKPFIGPDRCNNELDKLQCEDWQVKACIPDTNGSMMIVCTGDFSLTGYACPVVTKTSDNHLIIQSYEKKCNTCQPYETLLERLQRNNNTVGEECLRIYAHYPSKDKNADKTSLDGATVAAIVIGVVLIIVIVIILYFKFRNGKSPHYVLVRFFRK